MKTLALMLVAWLIPAMAIAQSAIIVDGSGSIQSVVREGPSGPIIYDGNGRIVTAVRGSRQATGTVVLDGGAVPVIGSTLRGGVGNSR